MLNPSKAVGLFLWVPSGIGTKVGQVRRNARTCTLIRQPMLLNAPAVLINVSKTSRHVQEDRTVVTPAPFGAVVADK